MTFEEQFTDLRGRQAAMNESSEAHEQLVAKIGTLFE